MQCNVLLSCNSWTKDTWFALAELAFSCIWLVVHSTYGPRARAVYTYFLGVWPQVFHTLTVNYSLPTLNLLLLCVLIHKSSTGIQK